MVHVFPDQTHLHFVIKSFFSSFLTGFAITSLCRELFVLLPLCSHFRASLFVCVVCFFLTVLWVGL